MKVLQINNYHYLKGGSEKVYFETSKILRENNHDVIHFSVNDSDSINSPTKKYFIEKTKFLNESIIKKIKSIPRFFYSQESAKKLEELIIAEKPDIAHLHIFYGRLTSSILPILKKYNIPIVMTIHEYKMLCPMYTFIDSKGAICEKCAEGNTYSCIKNKCNKNNLLYSLVSALEAKVRDYFFSYEKYIDKFLFVSDFIKEKHFLYKPHIKKKSITVSNFIDTDQYVINDTMGDYYLFFGRLSHEKGLIKLLDIWSTLSKDFKLYIIGDGNLKEQILEYIFKNNLSNVELLGPKYGKELIQYISGSKYVIVPSIWYETFGLTILESFACGKPVIGSNIGAIPNLVKNDKTGFLVDMFDDKNIKSIIEKSYSVSIENYKLLSRNCQNISIDFNKSTYYSELINVYKNVIG